MISLTIPGEPVCKGRPRVLRNGHAYTDKRTRQAEDRIRLLYMARYGRRQLRGKLRVGMMFWLGTKRRKDLDNLVKLVLDALNQTAWRDDSQVVQISAGLHRGAKEALTVVEIEDLD